MKPEEIAALAHEYAEEEGKHDIEQGFGEFFFKDMLEFNEKEFKSVLKFLLRRFCLIEKDTVREALYKLTDKFLEDNNHKAFGAASAAIESLFPEIAKEVEG